MNIRGERNPNLSADPKTEYKEAHGTMVIKIIFSVSGLNTLSVRVRVVSLVVSCLGWVPVQVMSLSGLCLSRLRPVWVMSCPGCVLSRLHPCPGCVCPGCVCPGCILSGFCLFRLCASTILSSVWSTKIFS